MAVEELVVLLRQGAEVWNEWRRNNPISRLDLAGADLSGVDLTKADLRRLNLSAVDLRGATLFNVDFHEANLMSADLRETNLRGADLRRANLIEAYLVEADLTGADLTQAKLHRTVFGDTRLKDALGLDSCDHWGPSIVDYQTLQVSGPLPTEFVQGVGLPDTLIDYLPSLLNQPNQFYSCFISYSSKDQVFADRLHADLQNKGVRCWFAPHDMPIGAKILDALDEAIRLRDKVLLILSEGAIASDWVEDEVSKAFAEERGRKQVVLFPIRLDDAVRQSPEPWARKLRDQRNIGDFTCWRDHDSYQKSFDRLVRDLTMKQTHDSRAGREGV